MHVVASAGAVQSPGYRFNNQCIKPDAWHAKWIWPTGQPDVTAMLFRKTVKLNAAPTRVVAWASADVCYRLYVNGRLVGRGPADIGRDYDREERGPRWLYDFHDLNGLFHAGDNIIAIEVFRERFVGSRVTRNKRGLLFEARITNADHETVVASDATWRAHADRSWIRGSEYDATAQIDGWMDLTFAAADWSPCQEIESVWTPLAASELPQLMEARYPISHVRVNGTEQVLKAHFAPISFDHDGIAELIYDRVLAAYPTLKIDGAEGATLRVVPGEQIGHQSRTMNIKLRDGVQCVEYPYLDSFSALKLEVKGVPTGHKVTVLDAGANFSSMPVSYAGSFACSDPHLNDLWATCRWLTQICMQTHHLDSPNHQEPICDPGDYLIESHANYYTFGSPWLARQDIRKFGLLLKDLNYRNFHTSYSLLWLQMLMAYYDHTGDAALVKEMAPEVSALLDTFTSWRGPNGLISEAPNFMFMDWVVIEGFECHHPPAVIGQGYMTAFYYRGLLDGIRAARLTGNKPAEEKYGRLRQEVRDAFNRELWSADRGLYRDGKPHQTHVAPGQWLPADKDIETFSPHVNTLAVLYNLAPADRQQKIMDRVFETNPVNCEPYFTYFVFEALAHCDSFEKHAPGLIARWKILTDTHTFHEMWNEGDLSHAWGSAPLIQLSSTVLGVRPISPGWAKISIEPHLMGLTWANGVVPTPHGDIRVAWKRSGDSLELTASIPPGLTAEVRLPGGAPVPVWKAGKHTVQVKIAN